jgi:hypothetical protein
LDEVRKEVRRRMDEVEAKYGVKITFEEPQAVESPATSVEAPVVKKLAAAIEKVKGKKSLSNWNWRGNRWCILKNCRLQCNCLGNFRRNSSPTKRILCFGQFN